MGTTCNARDPDTSSHHHRSPNPCRKVWPRQTQPTDTTPRSWAFFSEKETMSTKRKAPGKLAPPTVRSSANLPTKHAIDESKTSVADTDVLPSQAGTIEISSDEASDEDMSDDADEEEPVTNGVTKLNGNAKAAQLPTPGLSGAGDDEDEGEDGASPSFGELLRGNDAIDVPALLKQDSTSNAVTTRRKITAPSNQTLTTVLTQALRSDDTDLLESCLHTSDLPTIRDTIEQIDSTLAGALLNRLASRLHRRPGRAGSLMTWVQWTLIAHGGAIASQPKVIQSLSGLQKVLAERAKGLGSLLALKGKLDLLEGQMDMRRRMQKIASAHADDDEDEEDVIWVEGEHSGSPNSLANSRRGRGGAEDSDDDEPVMNGVVGDSSDEEDDDLEEEDDSEDDEESLDEDEVDHDDVDESMGEEEDSDVEAAPPSKLQKVGKAFGKKR